jgi:hypothetical protein
MTTSDLLEEKASQGVGQIKAAEIVGKIIALLQPLSSDERRRTVQASLILLGEAGASSKDDLEGKGNADTSDSDLPKRVKIWIQQNSLTKEDLEQVFHFGENSVDVIASTIPGKTEKDKTLNAYVLAGLSSFLLTGEPKFEDAIARSLCQSAGCYGATNHATYLKSRGNEFTGSKDSGWTLTNPGLKRGAALVKEIAASPND